MPHPKLLLHTCCAPCLTAVEERLREAYAITLYWYNPNIYPQAEYDRRLAELERFSKIIQCELIIPPLRDDRSQWERAVVDYAHEPEGQRRCQECILFRLQSTAAYAKEHGFAVFCTTLTVSPHKNAAVINNLGRKLGETYNIAFLEADFKKQDGYRRSIELSQEHGLYRQNYCGCRYSQQEQEARQRRILLANHI